MPRTARYYEGIAVDIRGLPEVQAMLARLDDPNVKKVLQQAMGAGAKAMKPALVAAAPYPGLKRAVWARTAKRQRPAAVVGHHKTKDSFFWHMIVGGTQDHGPRSKPWLAFWSHGRHYVLPRVKGIKPNPFVARAYQSARGEGATVIEIRRVIDEYIEAL
jgi:hypothetical protein